MAGIDKMYGNAEQWDELEDWLFKHLPEARKYMATPRPVPTDAGNSGSQMIANFPIDVDYVLFDKCPIGWVQERLEFQYGGRPKEVRPNRPRPVARPRILAFNIKNEIRPATIAINLQPFNVPNYAVVQKSPGRREDGFKAAQTIPLSEVGADALRTLCENFCIEVFTKAGKLDAIS